MQEPGSDEWSASYAELLASSVDAWNAIPPDEQLNICNAAVAAVPTTTSKCGGPRSRSRSKGGSKKRSKKGWTCYTRFFTETLAADGTKLSRVS